MKIKTLKNFAFVLYQKFPSRLLFVFNLKRVLALGESYLMHSLHKHLIYALFMIIVLQEKSQRILVMTILHD